MKLLRSTFLGVVLFASGGVLNTQMMGVAPYPRAIEGNPFSADVVNQLSKVLGDGNRIEQETHGKMYRDSQGRVRIETETLLPDGEHRQNISFRDPVQRVNISLDPTRKTARVFHNPDPAVIRKEQGQQPPPPERSQVSHKTEQLGSMTIEGFTATGFRSTSTTAANAVGNAQPLVSVNEVWRSTDLNVELMTNSSDPQFGETVRKLTNIQRIEPDPALFQIPADYAVTDVPPPQ